MRLSLCAVVLYAAFAAAFPSQNWIGRRDELAPLDQVTADDTPDDTPVELAANVTARSPSTDAGGDVVSIKDRDIEERKLAVLTWKRDPWKFKVKVTGSHIIQMWSSGTVRFYTRFRATGFWSYDYAIVCAMRDAGGRVYTLSRKGHVKGTFGFGSRTHTVDAKRYSPQVHRHWSDIVRGDRRMHCRVTVSNTISFNFLKNLIGQVINIVKKIGGVVSTVVAIF